MSFFSDGQSQHSGVPPSAQPYQSLFGGFSQETQDQDEHLRLKQDDYIDESDFDAQARGGQAIDYEDSGDNLEYIQTSDREPTISPKKDGFVARSIPSTPAPSVLKTRGSSESSASPEPYRPNKFHGPAQLWLDLTREDREIATALRDIGARDLAAHLYSAHVLQSQGAETADQDESEPQDGDFRNSELPDILEEWTAWPMPSDEVPRADECLRRLEDDKWTFRMRTDPRPSAELEASLTAFLMKTAKERFQSREWAPATFPGRRSFGQSDTDGPNLKTEGKMDVDKPSEDEDQVLDSEREDPQEPLRPIVQIDEDESRRKLRPLTRNVITQFENLLLGLHRFHGASRYDYGRSNRGRSRGRKRARSSLLAFNVNGREEDASDAENIHKRASSSNSRATQKAPGRNFSRGRKRTRRASQSSQQSHNSADASRNRASSTSTVENGETTLTDWRDVAGVASLIGLPPAVLQRATQRFSALLGEDMEPPMNLEDPGPQFMEGMLDWTSTRNNLTSLERDESRPRSNFASRPASLEKGATSSPTKRPGNALLSRKDNIKKDQPLFCPFKKCNRHKKGFSRRWNLNQHLKTMHPSYQPKDNKAQSRSGVQSGYNSDVSE
ncbi:uncharacterized protein BDV14DRAFT_46496 [Aspergillus stella-maris]|uniref:uncharacterized protein n=1 Tax=Aspergillus stella-maris TaxID=1810926 RepID=UPI003CCD4A03